MEFLGKGKGLFCKGPFPAYKKPETPTPNPLNLLGYFFNGRRQEASG